MREVSKSEFHDAFQTVIEDEDEIVVVHANTFAFGKMDDICAGVIEALQHRLLPHQTLLMPAFSWEFCRTGHYHYRNTPSEVGALSEHFRVLPGIERTPCPIYTYCGYGPRFQELAEHSQSESVWGEDSIFKKFYELNARIVGLGQPLSKCGTVFHYAEQLVDVPYRYLKTFHGKADFGGGEASYSKQMYNRRLDVPVMNEMAPIIEDMDKRHEVLRANVGMGVVESIRTQEAVDATVKLLEEDPLCLLATRDEFVKAIASPAVTFCGGRNLDFLAEEFCAQHKAETDQEPRLIEMPFGQYRQETLNPESDLRVIDPNYVAYLETAEDLFGHILRDPLSNRETFETDIQNIVAEYTSFIAEARKCLSGIFIVADFDLLNPSPLGDFDSTLSYGCAAMMALANRVLRDGLKDLPDVHIAQYGAVMRRVGTGTASSGKFYYLSRTPFSKEFNAALSQHLLGLMLALEGKTSRLLILDLDDTLWGGVAGEDGLSGILLGGDHPGNVFKDFQYFLKALSNRGIALAVCSKNNEDDAMEIIARHPDMVLREDDFAAAQINWDDKASNVRKICKSLGLTPASAMFIDNSELEREWVRSGVPECCVPDLPRDPAQWVPFLSQIPQLQAVTLTQEDIKRKQQYAQRRRDMKERDAAQSVEAYLAGLGMTITISAYGEKNSARILQLISKTNQFNTTTVRYKKHELERMIVQQGAQVYAVSLKDKYFEEEIIAVIVASPNKNDAKALEIDSLLMSCRAMGRQIETAMLAWLADSARAQGMSALSGQIVPTEKNQPVRELYANHGFSIVGEHSYNLALENAGAQPLSIPSYISVALEDMDATLTQADLMDEEPHVDEETPSQGTAGESGSDKAAASPIVEMRGSALFERLEEIFHTMFDVEETEVIEQARLGCLKKWDSKGQIGLLMEIEDELDCDFNDEDLSALVSFEAILLRLKEMETEGELSL